ncbi:ATP-binding protein [Candidatus Lucifugimonas marina]|uniref:AAA family ATPase n=1 Tax=Candidatus Lucifugimonas marina TaxID=3038979 RepID=A0AAJ6CTZ2_9CHLR|nr:AAA family ATPase [SAR202 cluster bacterium JH639]WFG34717.1 AAA family ATPase [SAR202 cluster bacterium JH545]WFG38644.1 AAA family ATPase [SAR202 cluster bacterium JH1073]
MSHVLRPGGSRSSRTGRSERRVLSVIFCDVANSTALAENIDPEEWVEIMNEAFEHMTAPILRYEGTIGKFTGDGMMAFFGAPTSHEEDPDRAVRASLEILEGIEELRDDIQRDYGEEFNLRIGINTGLVVVGEVGSAQVSEYTAMGDAVNVAARMEQTAAPGTLQISSDTQKLVKGAFDLKSLGGIEVKGKSQPVEVFRVTGTKIATGESIGVTSPLIGRDAELAKLIKLANQNKNGDSQVVSIIGEAGLGKSRLLSELRDEWLKTEPELSWEFSQGIPYDMGRPYSLFQNLARGMFGVELTDKPAVIHSKVHGALTTMGGAPDAIALCSTAVEKIIAAKVLHEAKTFTAEEIKTDLYQVVIPAFVAAAEEAPKIVIFDDLQWSDDASKDLIIHMMDYLIGTKMMIIFAFRPDADSPAQEIRKEIQSRNSDKYSEIIIDPLGTDHTNELIDELLQIKDIPQEARNLVLRKAEGNPYFVEEVVRWFVDQEMVHQTVNGLEWNEASNITDATIPDSVQALLMARMDRLSADAKDTLQLASVIGRAFYHRILGKISDSSLELDMQLTTLESHEMIQTQRDKNELQYMFKHELARDAAYSSILLRRRRSLHLRVAEAMESVFEDSLEDNAHRLGYHFSVAKDHERAMKYFEMATDIADGMNAKTEAENHLRNAISAASSFKAPEEKISSLNSRLTELVGAGA